MATINALQHELIGFRYSIQASTCGEAAQRIGRGTCTSIGAAGGTTIIDASGVANSGAADTYNGPYWARMLDNSANPGKWKRIVDDTGAGTLTLENNGFDNQVASGDEYEIWLMPEAEAVLVDSSSGETNMVDATKTEGTDFWAGYYAIPITGNRRGRKALVSSNTDAGTFVLAAGLGGALAAGDVVMLYKFIEVENIGGLPTEEMIAKVSNRTNFSVSDGLIGPRAGAISFDTEALCSGSLATATNEANASVLNDLMKIMMDEVIGTSVLVSDAAATTSQIDITTGSQENFEIGQMIIHQGNATLVTGKADGGAGVDTLDVSPPLPVAPQDGDTLYGTRMYKRSVTGNLPGINIELQRDEVRHKFFGAKGNIEIVDGPKLMCRFTLTYDHWIRDKEEIPVEIGDAYPDETPIQGHSKVFYLGTTKRDVNGFTATPGLTSAPKNVSGRYGINGVAGQQVTGQRATGSFRTLLESSGELEALADFHGRTSRYLACFWGSHGNTIAVTAPVMRLTQLPNEEPLDEMSAELRTWEAQDAGVFDDPTDGIVKIPDFAIHIS